MKDCDISVGGSVKILIVDDDETILDIFRKTVELAGYDCLTAVSGSEALEIMAANRVDVVVTDLKMPGMSGIDLTRLINERYGSEVMVMTGYANGLPYEKVIEAGASDFIQKPVRPKEIILRLKRVVRERFLLVERRKVNLELQKSLQKLRTALNQTVNALASTVEMRDPYTSGHQRRVTQIACAVAKELAFSDDQIDGIRIAGLLHDIGKISIPSEILSKPGYLTAAEMNLLRDHPKIGFEILKEIEFPWPIGQIVLQHHENLNGSGYPAGLVDEDILFEAKIICVADVVEAMSSHRPYRPSLGIEPALDHVSRNQGVLYDKDVVGACVNLFRKKGFTLD